ncbi:hypothetical protein [Ovoidimarina sediminis]|uniref:hypothetical protein n=1 Tax=Ovoidimarina sediminis TaxID=3079856 RepID=UPI0029143B9A|nr:hypothetical protein [Rhodophyticola sp. MJ-SS7]MDU8946528.1 hypothetical protein [Rhodophyticola sp. MJ-SS7]
MSGPNPTKLGLILTGLVLGATGLIFLKGGIYTNNHAGDVLHMMDIVMRMAAGERPHIDFMTPLGWLGFAPVVAFLKAGFAMGHAFALGQALMALVLIPAILRASASRLPPVTGGVFAALTVLVVVSLGQGLGGGDLSVSMFYNRWGWAVAFVAVVLAMLPDRGRPRPALDGAILGIGLGAVAMVKITYLVALAPALALVLVLRGERAMLFWALATGTATLLVFVVLLGPATMLAYLGDLRAVSEAPLRQAPGKAINDILASPLTLGQTVVTVGAALALRRSGRRIEGLGLLILFPAFTFLTWQNFGNVPFWLIPVAAIFAALWDRDRSLRVAGAGAIGAGILALPVAFVHSVTPLQHVATRADLFVPVVPGVAALADIYQPANQAFLVQTSRDLNGPEEPYPADDPRIRRPLDAEFAGRRFPDCTAQSGLQAAFARQGADMPAEAQVLVADILSVVWLYGPSAPVRGGAPWNYGTLDGAETATHLLVPVCPTSNMARAFVLDALRPIENNLREVAHRETYTLYEIVR